jgi:hypothetical protein
MSPLLYVKMAIAVIALLVSFYLGKKIEESHWVKREIELNQQAVDAKAAADKKVAAISNAYEQMRSAKQSTQTKITRSLSSEIAKNRSQYDCPVPDAAKLLIQQAASAANSSSSKPGGAVSKN